MLNITNYYYRNANQNYSEISPHTVGMAMIKNLQTIIAGEGVEKREPSCTVNGNIAVTMENTTEVP